MGDLRRVLISCIQFITLNYSIKIAYLPFQMKFSNISPRVITDEVWVQIQKTMQFYGCYHSRNSKDIMEFTLWRLRTGAPWRDIPDDFCPW